MPRTYEEMKSKVFRYWLNHNVCSSYVSQAQQGISSVCRGGRGARPLGERQQTSEAQLKSCLPWTSCTICARNPGDNQRCLLDQNFHESSLCHIRPLFFSLSLTQVLVHLSPTDLSFLLPILFSALRQFGGFRAT